MYSETIGIIGIKTINEKFSVCIKYHAKKEYLGVEVYLHAFLTLAIDLQITISLNMYVMNLKILGKAA
jgi:hypothetical protein